jgi:hypothetical protein
MRWAVCRTFTSRRLALALAIGVLFVPVSRPKAAMAKNRIERPRRLPAKKQPVLPTPSERLARQIIELSKWPLENIDQAVVPILGSTLGPPKAVTPYLTEWDIAPTELIAGGTVTRGQDSVELLVKPAPSLAFAFQDLETLLLDFPFYFESLQSHVGEDSMATAARALRYIFRTPRGQITLDEPVTIPPETHMQVIAAEAQGWDALSGRSQRRSVLSEISVGGQWAALWDPPRRTLRAFRTPATPIRKSAPGKKKP